MDLIWENASPTSNFAAQTISVDMIGYDMLFIKSVWHNNTQSNAQDFCADRFVILEKPLDVHRLNQDTVFRNFTIPDSTHITFSDSEAGNWVCVPYLIYGINLS